MAVAHGELRRKKEAMDLLVADIIKGGDDHEESNVNSSLRSAIERGWLHSFMDNLKTAKRRKEGEIDRICSRHYGSFLRTTDEMLTMRGSAQHLTELVVELHDDLSSTGGQLVNELDKLHTIQTERQNIRDLMEMAVLCKRIAQLMDSFTQLIEHDDYYRAMRTIENIQKEAQKVTVRSLSVFLDGWLPVAGNKVLYGARTDANTCIEKNRSEVESIGREMLRRQAALMTGVEPPLPVDAVPDASQQSIVTVKRPAMKNQARVTSISLSHVAPLGHLFNIYDLNLLGKNAEKGDFMRGGQGSRGTDTAQNSLHGPNALWDACDPNAPTGRGGASGDMTARYIIPMVPDYFLPPAPAPAPDPAPSSAVPASSSLFKPPPPSRPNPRKNGTISLAKLVAI